MRKLAYLFVSLILILDFVTNAQWQPEVSLTNNSGSSETTLKTWCIAASGNFVHCAWRDNRDGNFETYYKRSTDGGINWEPDVRLTYNAPYTTFFVSIAVAASNVHIVWQDDRDFPSYEIYYTRSTNNGSTWSSERRLTFNSANSNRPSIAASGTNIYVVWDDNRNNNYQIFCKRSTDAGSNWNSDQCLTSSTGDSCCFPSIAANGENIHVAWQDNRVSNLEIFYISSSNSGVNWSSEKRLTYETSASKFPCIAVNAQNINVVWVDKRDGNEEIYYKSSTDNGLSWNAETRMTSNPLISTVPNICSTPNMLHLIWREEQDGNPELYYKFSTNDGVTWESNTRLTYNVYHSEYPSITASGSIVHVVWYEDRGGNSEIYYKQNPSGNAIGIQNISAEIPSSFSLTQNYPNPFNPETKIRFDVPATSQRHAFDLRLVIYDALGREIAVLVNEQLKPGTYEADWNASNYPSGVYFYTLRTESFTETKKMILIK